MNDVNETNIWLQLTSLVNFVEISIRANDCSLTIGEQDSRS